MHERFVAVLRGPRGWRRFARPTRLVVARERSQVRDVLTEVDRAVRDGLYAAGFVTYEAAGAFGLPVKDVVSALPLAAFGLFDAATVEDLARLPNAGAATTGEWRPSIDRDAYHRAIHAIKQRIEAGDTYQINFTFRLIAPFIGEPAALMKQLYAAQAGQWSASIEFGAHVICSASPELFFLQNGARLDCLPMKGTAARGWWPAQDRARGAALQASPKNRAENVMIVDMVRNDLGRIATPGSVRVASLYDIERYPLQWQMTSHVMAEAPGAGLDAIFQSLFPSGSVTGAPKHSAMGIIRELESTPRGIYTGAIGYVSPNGRAHFNVAIRTVVIDRDRSTAEFGVGSGVVWDSVDRDEYQECLIKARMINTSGHLAIGSSGPLPAYIIGEQPDFALLETIRWDPAGGFGLLDRHLERLRASAECFGFVSDLADFRSLLDAAVAELTRPSKIRLLLERDGTVLCEAVDLEELSGRPLRAALAAEPVNAGDVFLFHKTTRRRVYERAREGRPDVDAVILWNTSSEITEGTDYNVVIEIDGSKATPPLDSGLLPGTLRAELLARGELVERRITVDELRAVSSGWLINSVRGWLPFTL